MKTLIRLVLLTLAVIIGVAGKSFAQQPTVQAIAYEKATRDTIFIKMPDSLPRAVLFSSGIFQLSKLAMLASSPDGKNFLVAGSFAGYVGILNIPANLDSIIAANPTNPLVALGTIKKLMHYPLSNAPNQFRPIGVLSADGSQWWVNFVSESNGEGLMKFYHGSMNQNETDPGAVVDSVAAVPALTPIRNYHMSNLALSQNNVMVAISADLIDASQNLRYMRYRWDLSTKTLNLLEFQNQVASLNNKIENADSMFGFALRVFRDGNQDMAEFGITNVGTTDNSITFYKFSINSSSISLNNATRTISRSFIPDSVDFFAGPNIGPYQETYSAALEQGNAGDIMFTPDGNNVVFITHGARENGSLHSRNVNSAIYTSDFGSATLFYNDTSAQELQPVFVTVPLILPSKPGEAQLNRTQLSFGTVDTGTASTLTIDVTDTGANPLIVDSVRLRAGSKFVLTGGIPTPYTLTHGQSQTYTVTFNPVAPAGLDTGRFIVYYNRGSSVSAPVTGTSKVKPAGGGGVAEDPTLAPFFAVSPNPFAATTTIRLTAPSAGSLGIVVHDELGRIVYTSDVRKTGIGSVESFTFDPSELGLSAGVYYVTAAFGEKQITRQLRYAK